MQQKLVGLGPGAAERACGVVTRLQGVALGISCSPARVLGRDTRLVERARELRALTFGLAQRLLERSMELREMRFGAAEHARIQAEARRDGERVRCAGEADVDAICGAKRLGIELDARVHHARRGQRERLELGIVGRRRDQDATREQRLEHGHRERRSLIGIGTRAELVEQRDVALLGLRERRDHVAQVRGEGREALRDRLLVPDVGEDPLDDRHPAAAAGGDLQSARGHQHEQADRLEGHGLPAGVRSGDHERLEVGAEAHVDRDNVAALGDEQRMARGHEVELPVAVEERPLAVEEVRQLGLREGEIDARERGHQRLELVAVLLDAARQLVEDPLHLGPLGQLGLAQRVVRFEDLQRLDEDGRPRRGLIVDDALHRAAHLRLHGHDIAAAAQRHDRLLERARELTLEQPVEPLLKTRLRRAQLRAKRTQPRARAVEHLGGPRDGVLDGLRERARRASELRKRGERGVRAHVLKELLGGADRVRDAEQLIGIQRTAEARAPDRVADVLRAADPSRRLRPDERPRRGGLVLKACRVLQVGRRRDAVRQLAPWDV